MLLQAHAKLPIDTSSLADALRGGAEFIEQHLSPGPDAELAVSLAQTGSRGNAFLARVFPPETRAFHLGLLPVGEGLTARSFRDAIPTSKPTHTASQIRVRGPDSHDAVGVIRALADELPASARGVILAIGLRDWQIAGRGDAIAVDVVFSRLWKPKVLGARVTIRFQALSTQDPLVTETLAEASRRLDVPFENRLWAVAPGDAPDSTIPARSADPRLRRPTAPERLVVVQSVFEALARAADAIKARPEDLDAVPLLFTRTGAFNKRMTDVVAGKKEAINLPTTVKRFMKARFPSYAFEARSPDRTTFRRGLAETLDVVVTFERIHHWGLGKSFDVSIGVDFPNTPFGGMRIGYPGTGANVGWLFHHDRQGCAWAYTSRAELTEALDGCGALFERVLPAIEEQCRSLLIPVPEALPQGIPIPGALSARDAVSLVWPMAQSWARDVELQTITSGHPAQVGGSKDGAFFPEGRLTNGSAWSLALLSKGRDMHCRYSVPHTGRVWWTYAPVLQNIVPKYDASVGPEDWVDSPEIARRALEIARQQMRGSEEISVMLTLGDLRRASGNFVWTAMCSAAGGARSGVRPLVIRLDRHTGTLIETSTL